MKKESGSVEFSFLQSFNKMELQLQAPISHSFSMLEFNQFMPIPLSHIAGSSIPGWHIFSDPRQISNSTTKQKVKGALELFDFICFPSLVQFWSPTTSQEFLHSSDLPFALNGLRKGMCSFRKHCSSYTYSVHGDPCGPPARVFRRRFPEFCPDIGYYFEEEYELKGLAMASGIRGYLCLPVFEPTWHFCIGVLEIFTIMDGSYCFGGMIEKVSASLKEVGLSCSDVFWPFDTKHITHMQLENADPQYKLAVCDVQNALEVLCDKHKLPFAQTWVATSGGSSKDSFISTVKTGSYMSMKKVSSFKKDCSWFHLGKGQGIVWKAFLSGSCFCRDITRLSIVDYALVLGARKVELMGGFAICLQSSYTTNLVYIIELFLPPNQTIYQQPWIFLTSLLDTMKQLFKTFKLSSGEEIGSDLSVAVLQTSEDDPLDPFVIGKTIRVDEGSRNEADESKRTAAEPLIIHAEANISGPDVEEMENTAASLYASKCFRDGNNRSELNPQKIMLAKTGSMRRALSFEEAVSTKANKLASFPDNAAVQRTMQNSTNPATGKNGGSSRKRSEVDCSLEEHIGKSIRERVSCCASPPDEGHICLTSASPVTTTMLNDGSLMTVKAEFKGDVVKFRVPAVSGIMKLKDEVTKRLNLNAATFEIKYHHEDNSWVLLDTDAKLWECARVARSSGMSAIKLSVVSVIPQTEEVENATKTMIKASYKDDLIKFEFSLSAGMSELENEIMKRVKLAHGSFVIKYTDENNCPVLLDGDAALQNCTNAAKLLQKTTMRLSIQPISNECTDTVTVKASYAGDIIKFKLSLSSGMMKLKDEVSKRLKLEDGSYAVKYIDDDRKEVIVDGDAALTKYMNTVTSMGIHALKISLQPV